MVNYGTPIISIVDVNYDVRQLTPSNLLVNAYIQSSASSPVYVTGLISTIVAIGSIGTVSSVGSLGTVSSIGSLGIVSSVGSLGTVSSIGSLGIVSSVASIGIVSSVASIGIVSSVASIGAVSSVGKIVDPVQAILTSTLLGIVSSPLFSVPVPVSTYYYEGIAPTTLLTASTAFFQEFYLGSAPGFDFFFYAFGSTLVSSATYSLSVQILPVGVGGQVGSLYISTLFISTFTQQTVSLVLRFTDTSTTVLGDNISIGVTTSTNFVYDYYIKVIPK
ncbi:MAG: hypothetical protein QXV17_06560 [Candidatus Micrarchaeaceae archaeon]